MRIRFLAKAQGSGAKRVWGVYDRDRGCWPRDIPGFGTVRHDLATEQEAQAEADRLAEFMGKGGPR